MLTCTLLFSLHLPVLGRVILQQPAILLPFHRLLGAGLWWEGVLMPIAM
jgi:hypothetical protein